MSQPLMPRVTTENIKNYLSADKHWGQSLVMSPTGSSEGKIKESIED